MSSAELYQQFPPAARVRAAARRDSMQRAGGMTRADTMQLLQQARRINQFVADLTSSRVARAVMSERQLQEVMVDFWENHFTVFAGKGQTRWYLTSYDRDVIRPNALGHFRDLLGAVAKSPGDAVLSRQRAERRRHRRSTLRRAGAEPGTGNREPGNGGDAGFGVSASGLPDARTARFPVPRSRFPPPASRSAPTRPQRELRARADGAPHARRRWRLHAEGRHRSRARAHRLEHSAAAAVVRAGAGRARASRSPSACRTSTTPASSSSAPRCTTPKRRSCSATSSKAGRGIEDGEQVLDILARHPSTAKFIARKLAVRFVSDQPPQALVDRAAATFTRTDGDIREVVRTIVTSPEFFSKAAFRSKVKSPFEVVVSTLRALDAAPDATPRTAQLVARLGQPIFGHQAPNGWPETSEAVDEHRARSSTASTSAWPPRRTAFRARRSNRWPDAATAAQRAARRAGRRRGRVAARRSGVAADARDPDDGRESAGRRRRRRIRRRRWSRAADSDADPDPTMAAERAASATPAAIGGTGVRQHSRADGARAGRRARVRLAGISTDDSAARRVPTLRLQAASCNDEHS